MKLGFVYAGQGSQKVGMGQDFYETYPVFRQVFDNAREWVKDVTDFDLKKLCFEGPMEQLSQTRFTQPCMVSFAVGVTKLLEQENIKPEYVCGLSLGEYSALYAAGVLTEEDVLKLVAYRGKVMAEAVSGREVKMSAVLMVDRDIVVESCREATERLKNQFVTISGEVTGEHYVVQAANFNCPGQIAISGDAAAVDLATEIIKEKGGKRVVPLAVSGPFHTSLMKPAGDKLRVKLEQTSFGEQKAEVIFNATGMPKKVDETYEDLLEKQVQSSVYLEDSIRYMAEQGVDTIVEIGPGATISKFVQKTAPGIQTYHIDSVDDYVKVLEALGGENGK